MVRGRAGRAESGDERQAKIVEQNNLVPRVLSLPSGWKREALGTRLRTKWYSSGL